MIDKKEIEYDTRTEAFYKVLEIADDAMVNVREKEETRALIMGDGLYQAFMSGSNEVLKEFRVELTSESPQTIEIHSTKFALLSSPELPYNQMRIY